MTPEVVVLPDPAAAAAAAADRIVEICERAVALRGACALALAGGDTPRTLYARLAAEPYRGRIAWDRVQVFWSDERGVPPDDPRSNFRMTRDTLLAAVPLPEQNIHRMPAADAAHDAAARAYADALRTHVPPAADGWPRFDLMLLGIGEDAHVASLFPGAPALRERERPVVAYFVEKLGMWRMTLTLPVFAHAAEILFLAVGASKARAVAAALHGPAEGDAVPAALIRPVDGRVTWLLDGPAASRLTPGPAGGS